MKITPEIQERLNKLSEKYNAMGQDMLSYLDGLIYSDYLTYWDYIHLDVLLNLQNPRTSLPDEEIFIMYHQITELYFKLSINACRQITEREALDDEFFIIQLKRINSYFHNLIHSFDIMVDGMAPDQFLKFRMALLPASGFQSAQYRMIQIYATDFENLVVYEKRKELPENASVKEIYEKLYWRGGSVELSTGKATLTLRQFEGKYKEEFQKLAKKVADTNLWKRYKNLPEKQQQNENLIKELKKLDMNTNVRWPLMHYKSAVRYLHKEPEDIAATGGTNWQKYLPPKNQRVYFYPELWTEEEIEKWGRML